MSDELIGTARGIVDAFNASDWDGFQNLMTEDAVYDEVGTSRTIKGVNTIIEAMKAWKDAMPDVKGTVDSAASTGNGVVLEVTWRGTSHGSFGRSRGVDPGYRKEPDYAGELGDGIRWAEAQTEPPLLRHALVHEAARRDQVARSGFESARLDSSTRCVLLARALNNNNNRCSLRTASPCAS